MQLRLNAAWPVLLLWIGSCAPGPGGDEPSRGSGDSRTTTPMACSDLPRLELEDAEITRAEIVPPGGFELPPSDPPSPVPAVFGELPAFCRVAVTVTPVPGSRIGFEVWLPEEEWNGGFLGLGDGGLTGAIFHRALAEGVRLGYAVANTDGGHEGSAADTSFALERPESVVDYAWRALDRMTVLSKQIVQARYGRSAERAIWNGCSTGGRQGLKMAQRFPSHYDGVVAGAPAHDWVPLMLYGLQRQQRLSDPEGGLSPDKLPLLATAATLACDAEDGVEDGIIGRPQACAFDPADLACEGTSGDAGDCLADHEIAAARTLYAGIVDAAGTTVYPGSEFGSEREWAAFQPGVFPIGENYVRDVLYPERDWDLHAFDVSAEAREAQARDTAEMAAVDPNLGPFVANGGRLLLWHGLLDGLIPARSTIGYHAAVTETIGQDSVDEALRLYVIPGLAHCSGGPGVSELDWLEVMEDWLATGEAPGRLIASRPAEQGGEGGEDEEAGLRTRPLCPHPQEARYDGTGDVDDAASWTCTAP